MFLPGTAGCPHHQDKKPEDKVKVIVAVILASDRCPYVHPRLRAIAAELKKGDPSLTGFTLVSITAKSLAAKQKAKFHCVEDCYVEVEINHCVDQAKKVCLSVTAPLQGEIVCRCVCEKFLPIVTRYQTRQRIPPHYVALALGHMCSGSPAQRMLALETLQQGRCCDRLILAISVMPCDGK
jgi:hypothetical protein